MSNSQKPITPSEVKNLLADHLSDLKKKGVLSIRVFGSVARQEATPSSDIDLLIEFDDRPIGLFEFIEINQQLEKILSRKVDLVTEKALKAQLRDQILSEAINVA